MSNLAKDNIVDINKILESYKYADKRYRNYSYEDIYNLKEMCTGMLQKLDNMNNYGHNIYIDTLIREKKVLILKLSKSIPNHMIVYLCVNFLLLGASIACMTTQLILGKTLIANYILFLIGFMNVGLICTTLRSLKDWKENLLSNEEKEQLKEG